MSAARQLACPACGGALSIESAFTTLVVCPFCGQSLYVHDSGVDPTGHTAKLADYPSRLSIGRRGAITGRSFKTLGRMRFENDDGFWDEWFLQFDDQQVGWLEENEGALTLTFKHALTTPLPPIDQIRTGGFLPVNSERMFVSAKGHARVAGAEGEMTMTMLPGRAVDYITGSAGQKVMRLLLAESSITFYVGQSLEFGDVVMRES